METNTQPCPECGHAAPNVGICPATVGLTGRILCQCVDASHGEPPFAEFDVADLAEVAA